MIRRPQKRMTVKQLKQHVDRRFRRVDKRFADIDRRFDAIDGRFEAVDRRFGEVLRRLDSMNARVDFVITQLRDQYRHFNAIGSDHENRLRDLEGRRAN